MDTQVNTEEYTHQKIDKIKRYGWKLRDKPGVFIEIHKEQLLVDHSYQRADNSLKAIAVAQNWSWVACGAIIVADRDGEFYVVDGQHRVLAARKRSDIKELPCLVFDVGDIKEEANGFLNANIARKAMTSFDKYRAGLVAGDEICLYLERIYADYGIEPTTTSKKKYSTKSVAWCIKAATKNKSNFEKVFSVSVRLCKGEQIPDRLLKALMYIHTTYDDFNLDDRRFVDRLMSIGIERLLAGMARAATAYATGGEKVWGEGILLEVNKGLRTKFR